MTCDKGKYIPAPSMMANNGPDDSRGATGSAADGWKYVPVLVPVGTFQGEDILDGRALKMIDMVKAEAFRQKAASLEKYVRDHVHAYIDSDEIERLLSFDEWRAMNEQVKACL